MSNRELTYAQRQEFAARSALHARFDLFVQAIVRVAAGKVHRLGGISKEALCAGLKLLFDEADLDNNKVCAAASPLPYDLRPPFGIF